MERSKRKPVPGKNSRGSIRRTHRKNCTAKMVPEIFFNDKKPNNEGRTHFITCPHCLGFSFEEIVGVCEDKVCPDCEHEKTAWLIKKYEADAETRKKKNFAPVEPKRKRRRIVIEIF